MVLVAKTTEDGKIDIVNKNAATAAVVTTKTILPRWLALNWFELATDTNSAKFNLQSIVANSFEINLNQPSIMGINVDFKMLPMKAHYFLYNAGR